MTSVLFVAVIISLASLSHSQHRYFNQRFMRNQRLYNQPPLRAVAVLRGQKVNGVVHFEQQGDLVRVFGQINGLSPGYHGFHVHQYGDLSDSCTSAGPHFNPQNREHGSPVDFNRHVGDLGNIEADENGVAAINVSDYLISLVNQHSIVGRAVVVHADVDDLGRGGQELSKSTGNAGGRLACGVIGWAKV